MRNIIIFSVHGPFVIQLKFRTLASLLWKSEAVLLDRLKAEFVVEICPAARFFSRHGPLSTQSRHLVCPRHVQEEASGKCCASDACIYLTKSSSRIYLLCEPLTDASSPIKSFPHIRFRSLLISLPSMRTVLPVRTKPPPL